MKIEHNGQSLTFCFVDENAQPKFQRHYFSVGNEAQRDYLKGLIDGGGKVLPLIPTNAMCIAAREKMQISSAVAENVWRTMVDAFELQPVGAVVVDDIDPWEHRSMGGYARPRRLFWPKERSGFEQDTLSLKSAKSCDYCEWASFAGLDKLRRLHEHPLRAALATQPAKPADVSVKIKPWEDRGDDFERSEGNAKWYVAAMDAEIAELRAALSAPVAPEVKTIAQQFEENEKDAHLRAIQTLRSEPSEKAKIYYASVLKESQTQIEVPQGELPPLPKGDVRTDMHIDGKGHHAYTIAQLRAYAAAAVAQERERLNFMIEQTAWIQHAEGNGYQVWTQNEDEEYDVISEGGEDIHYATEREAIDSAIRNRTKGN